MKDDNIILLKSFSFALEVVKICRLMEERRSDRILSNQLLRSGTSIGANVEEAVGAQSPADFHAKITIAYKEAREKPLLDSIIECFQAALCRGSRSLASGYTGIIRILAAIQLSLKRKRWTSSNS